MFPETLKQLSEVSSVFVSEFFSEKLVHLLDVLSEFALINCIFASFLYLLDNLKYLLLIFFSETLVYSVGVLNVFVACLTKNVCQKLL